MPFIISNQTFSKLKSFYQNQTYLTEILEKISETLPEQVYLTNLSFIFQLEGEKNQEKQVIKVNLFGFSKTRDILLEFKKNLEVRETFKEIYFPPSNWIKATDINFNITFKIK